MNKVIVIGNLTKDPEIRITNSGKKVASFSIAVNEGKDSSGQDLVQYFNLSAWERLAEILEQYVKKGTKVAVVGKLQNRSWDKQDGTKGYATDIVVRELEILTSKMDVERMGNTQNSNTNNDTPKPTEPETKEVSKQEIPEIDVDSINVQMPF